MALPGSRSGSWAQGERRPQIVGRRAAFRPRPSQTCPVTVIAASACEICQILAVETTTNGGNGRDSELYKGCQERLVSDLSGHSYEWAKPSQWTNRLPLATARNGQVMAHEATGKARCPPTQALTEFPGTSVMALAAFKPQAVAGFARAAGLVQLARRDAARSLRSRRRAGFVCRRNRLRRRECPRHNAGMWSHRFWYSHRTTCTDAASAGRGPRSEVGRPSSLFEGVAATRWLKRQSRRPRVRRQSQIPRSRKMPCQRRVFFGRARAVRPCPV